MCGNQNHEKIRELKHLLDDYYITDEEIIAYIKNSLLYNNIKKDIKEAIVVEYLRRQELENEEKEKNDFIDYINNNLLK